MLTGCLQMQGRIMFEKKIYKGKLELNSELWIFFTFQQGLAPS